MCREQEGACSAERRRLSRFGRGGRTAAVLVDAAVGATRLTACKAPSLVRLAATANPAVTLTLALVDASAPPAVACFAVVAAAVAASYRSCRQTRQSSRGSLSRNAKDE